MVNKSSATPAPARGPGAAARKRRARGRPKTTGAEDVRDALLNAARELFLRYGYRSVSSRQIAAAAGANVAMIRYYFGGKPGLYKEMLQGTIEPLLARFSAVLASGSSIELSDILSGHVRTIAANPWLVGVVLREVLTPDGPLRATFRKEGPEKLKPLLERAVRNSMETGKIRADLDPNLVVLSMASLAVFPFLAQPLTSQFFGVRGDEAFLKRFLQHTTELLSWGLQGKKE
jgi:TetR/AcrR family transcriptional regulator